jgi:hypothetical protein
MCERLRVFVHVQFGWTVLMRATANGQVDCARMLLDAGADKDATSNVRVGRCVFCCASVSVLPCCFF